MVAGALGSWCIYGMAQRYNGLSPSQVAVSAALVASARWGWGSGTTGLTEGGALVEIMPGRPVAMNSLASQGLIPMLTEPNVMGHLMSLLAVACGAEVSWSVGQRGGSEAWCALEAGGHRREWTGTCLGEALAGALVARWTALDRRDEARREALGLPARGRPTRPVARPHAA